MTELKEPENELLTQVVEGENPLKQMFVQYVGEKLEPENGEVTVEMIIDVLADEFPEFVLAVAEENFIRGYKQAFVDMESVGESQEEAT
jgi:hypothetical protein